MLLITLILAFFVVPASCLNIIFYVNAIGKSHLDFTDSLIGSLTDAGHTVDLVIARINDKVEGFGKNKAERVYSFGFKSDNPWMKHGHLLDPFKESTYAFGGFRSFQNAATQLCQIGLNDDDLMEFLSQRKYDIGVVSYFDYCGTGILYEKGVKSITTFTAIPLLPMQAITLGLPSPASLYIPLFDTSDLSSLSARVWNLLDWAYINIIQVPEVYQAQSKMLKARFGADFDMEAVADSVDISFVNSNEIMERPRPLNHKIQYIGGINLRSPKPVDKKLNQYLSTSNRGTVIFSFGTQVPSELYPRHVVRNFVNVFKNFSDYTFLWKYDIQKGEEDLFKGAKNVFAVDWLPQTDLLYDDRVVGFISHVGMNSFNEASFAGKPILAIPLFADQPNNAENGVLRGTAYKLDKTQLTEKTITRGLEAILYDSSYRNTSLLLKKMLEEKPNQPKERFVKWVEYAAANPGLNKIFELPGSHMGVFEYYSMDAVIFLTILGFLITFVLYKILKFLVSLLVFSGNRKNKKE